MGEKERCIIKEESLFVLDKFSSHLKNSVKEKLRQENTELVLYWEDLLHNCKPLMSR